MTGTRLSHVELYVSDYAKSIRFYDQILPPLGWERLVCQKSHTTFCDGQMKIVLCPTEEKFQSFGYHRKRIGLNHLAFYASSRDQVDEIYTNILVAKGISVLYEGKPTGDQSYYSVFFEDPDRIKLEIVYAPNYCSKSHWTNQIEDDFDPYKIEEDL